MSQRHVGAAFLALFCLRIEAQAENSELDVNSLSADLQTLSLIKTLKDERIKSSALSTRGAILSGADYLNDIQKGGDDAVKANLKLGVNFLATAATGGLALPAQMAVGAVVDVAVDHLYQSYVINPRKMAAWTAMIDRFDAASQADSNARLQQFYQENAKFLSRFPRDPSTGKISPPVIGSGTFSVIDTSGVSAGRARETLGYGSGALCSDMAWYRGECTRGGELNPNNQDTEMEDKFDELDCGSKTQPEKPGELSAANYACDN